MEKTEKGAIIAKTRLQIVSRRRQTDMLIKDLGKKVYNMSKTNQTNVLDNDEVKQFISKVEDLEGQVEGLKKNLKKLAEKVVAKQD